MNNLIRERKGMLILSLLVILLPMGLGLFLWNQLPDQVPIHFGLNGQADNYAGLEILEVNDYPSAVAAADSRSEKGDVVILSPASTSFDRFANFMERGRVFKELVNALP